MWVIKAAAVPGVGDSVSEHLIGNGGWIFTEVSGNLAEGLAFIQRTLNISTVIKGEMFMVSWN